MTKYLVMQAYGSVKDCPPMTEWAPEEVQAHIDFQIALNRELMATGELVDAEALTAPELAKFVVSDGVTAPAVTDGPYPESKELLAGYRVIDVESEARAIEIAARVSAAPGPGGLPIKQEVELRQVMGRPGLERVVPITSRTRCVSSRRRSAVCR